MGLFSIKPQKTTDDLTKTDDKVETTAYCMKCKKTVTAPMLVEKKQTRVRLVTIYRGNCPDCNTRIVRIA